MDRKEELKVERMDLAKIRKKEVSKVLYHEDAEGIQKYEIDHLHLCVSYSIV